MHTRLLLPNRSVDPRWGYLDKFDEGRYWAPSLAVTVLAVAAAIVATMLWPQSTPPPLHTRIGSSPFEVQRILPVPSIVPRSSQPQPVVRQRETGGRITPVPAVVPQHEPVAVNAMGVGGDIAVGADDGRMEVGALETEGIGIAPLAWPDPDAFIPVENAPVLVSMPTPSYPELAREAAIEGMVLVRALVGADGFVHKVLIVEGTLGLDAAALAAVSDAVFRPALQQERPVAVWVVVPIEFRLRD